MPSRVSCLIPQDFNLDLQASGDIVGQHSGDSKLLAMVAKLHSLEGNILLRRMRAGQCDLTAVGVMSSSNVESSNLRVTAGAGGFSVGKRLGLDREATIYSQGPVKVASLFCMMRNLPAVDNECRAPLTEGVMMTADSNIDIDVFQGVASIKSDHEINIKIGSAETVKF